MQLGSMKRGSKAKIEAIDETKMSEEIDDEDEYVEDFVEEEKETSEDTFDGDKFRQYTRVTQSGEEGRD